MKWTIALRLPESIKKILWLDPVVLNRCLFVKLQKEDEKQQGHSESFVLFSSEASNASAVQWDWQMLSAALVLTVVRLCMVLFLS